MTLSQNKKAFADYEVLEKIEAGIELTGPEVKSIRAGQTNLKGSYIEIKKGEAFTNNVHVSPYKQAHNQESQDPLRPRRLLLHKKEIEQIDTYISQDGIAVVPLDFHLKNNRIKLTIGVCRGKKKHDRRSELKKKAQDLEIRRTLRNR
jgi:SsrA-binding protein